MKNYTTAQIAKFMNVHPNTILLYERLGNIEEAKRKSNGYRIFTQRHLEQMKLARELLKDDIVKIEFRFKSANIIKLVVSNNLEEALSNSYDYLSLVKRENDKDSIMIKESLNKLKVIKSNNFKIEFKTHEIAELIGVTNDVLIAWERNGLLDIKRNKINNYRIFSKNDLIMASFIKVLRDLKYTANAVFKLINTIKFNNDKSLNEIIYDLNLDYEIKDEFDRLLNPLRDIESNIIRVINHIENLKVMEV